MAGEKNTVETVVKVKYESSGVLNDFIRDLDRMGKESQRASAGIRNLASPLAFELAPALWPTGRATARLVGSVATLGTGFGALAAAATGLAGIVAGQLGGAWQKPMERHEEWGQPFSR